MKDFLCSLPQGFLAEALALTTPQDASRLSSVNSFFRSVADWDTVWAHFVPPEWLAEAVGGGRDSMTMKEVYLRLCDHPTIIEDGHKSFWLDKLTGKKCYMLGAKQLSIVLMESPNCWRWTSIAESRFTEVAEIISVCSLEVSCNINTSILSPNTTYVAHLVFKTTAEAYGFEYQPVEVCIGPYEDNSQTRMVYLDPQVQTRRRLRPRRRIGIFRSMFANYNVGPPPTEENCPKKREDGWFEVEIGEYFNKGGEGVEVEMSVMEVKGGNWKSGLIIQGIEIRPKKWVSILL